MKPAVVGGFVVVFASILYRKHTEDIIIVSAQTARNIIKMFKTMKNFDKFEELFDCKKFSVMQ